MYQGDREGPQEPGFTKQDVERNLAASRAAKEAFIRSRDWTGNIPFIDSGESLWVNVCRACRSDTTIKFIEPIPPEIESLEDGCYVCTTGISELVEALLKDEDYNGEYNPGHMELPSIMVLQTDGHGIRRAFVVCVSPMNPSFLGVFDNLYRLLGGICTAISFLVFGRYAENGDFISKPDPRRPKG